MAPTTAVATIEWAAGLFDGEGSISLVQWGPRAYRSRRLLVAVKQSAEADRPGEVPEVLERFARAVAVGAVGGPYSDRATRLGFSSKRRPYFMWYAIGESAEAALDALWPHLGRVKRQQAEQTRERGRVFNAAVVLP